MCLGFDNKKALFWLYNAISIFIPEHIISLKGNHHKTSKCTAIWHLFQNDFSPYAWIVTLEDLIYTIRINSNLHTNNYSLCISTSLTTSSLWSRTISSPNSSRELDNERSFQGWFRICKFAKSCNPPVLCHFWSWSVPLSLPTSAISSTF